MVQVPDQLWRHRDLQGRERRPWTRWFLLGLVGLLLGLVGLLLLLGLLNVFGQRPETTRAESAAASLKVYAPSPTSATGEQDVELHDGETPILHLDRTVTIFP